MKEPLSVFLPVTSSKNVFGVYFFGSPTGRPLLSLKAYVNSVGGSPKVSESMRYTVASIFVFSVSMAAGFLPAFTMSRSCSPNSRNLDFISPLMRLVLSLENVSGMTDLGTSPYFSVRSATPQNVPPSFSGCWKKKRTRSSSIGFLAQSITP